MLSERVFAREETLPSWFMNATGYFLSLNAAGFQVTIASPTTIEVIAGADEAAAIIAVSGSWRWVEATVSRAHPGGAAGTYDIYVTAKATDIVSTPVVFTDSTDYAWDLAIVAHGATPPIVAGTVDIFRKVGELQWDGAAITRVDQLVPATPRHAHTHASGQPDAIAPSDIGAVATGSAGTLASLHLTGAGTALAVDHDATVGGTLAVTGASTLAGLVTAQAGLSLDAGAGTAGQTLTLTGRTAGAAVSSTLAVSAAGALTVTSGTASLVGATSGGTAFTSSTTAFNIPGTSQYQVGGTQIALANLSNGTTGTGTTVVLSASPTLTGVPLAPTAAPGTNTTQLATTAFVTAAVGAVTVPVTSVFGRTGAVVKVAGDYAVADVTGAAPLASPTFTGTTTIATLSVTGNGTVTGTLGVTGLLTATGGVTVPAKAGAAYVAGQVAANAVLQNYLLGTDTTPAFRINGDGQHQWGPGGVSGSDTFLYRNGVGLLRTDGALSVGGTVAVTGAATLSGGATVTGALTSTTDQKARFGAATEVGMGAVVAGKSGIYFQGAEAGSNLYRSAAGALTIDGILTIAGAGTGLAVTNNATVGGTLGVTGTTTLGTAAVTTFSGTPNFSGNATAVTQAANDNSTRLATTAYADRAGLQTVRLANDFTATGSMVNVTGFSLAIGAGEVYHVEVELIVSQSTTMTTALQFTGPASPTLVAISWLNVSATAAAAAKASAFSSSFGTGSNALSVLQRIVMTVVNGANAGTVQLQCGSTTGQVLQAGSFMQYRKGS